MTFSKHHKRSLSSFFHSYITTSAIRSRHVNTPPILHIKPSFPSHSLTEIPFQGFVEYMTRMVGNIIPEKLKEEILAAKSSKERGEALATLNSHLPLITFSDPQGLPSTVCATLLCPALYTQGVGRYFTDAISRWLIPGKFLPVFSAQSLNFHFVGTKKLHFFIHQIILPIEDKKELALIQNNFPSLADEIKLTIHAVKRSRRILASALLTPEQKRSLIEQSISSILNRPSIEADSNVFDQMNHFLLKLAGEEKEAEIKKSFATLMQQKPFLFDRDIFSEIRHFVLLFRDHFTALRSHRHIAKTISILYFIRKSLVQKIKKAPNDRHLELKLFKANLSYPNEQKNVLSLLIGINILQENELLGQRHILSAIENSVPNVKKVRDSFTLDRRAADNIRLFYLEIEKRDGANFSLKEVATLKKRLPRALKGRIENVLHPVALSRNEEEIMRNIVMLSQELKYVHDIPQVYISFDAQMGLNLSFTVILLRLLHQKPPPVKETLSLANTPLNFFDFEKKQVSFLRKRYPKEANVFRVELDKTPFLRRDFSLDLFKARLVVSEELSRILGEIRDFNGGILSKQQEALLALKAAVKGEEKSNDFLVENFFFSLTPVIMRTILYSSLLTALYRMMLEALERDFINEHFWIKSEIDKEYTLIMIASPYGSFHKEVLCALSQFNIAPLDLTTTYNDSNEVAYMGIIHRCDTEQKNRHLHQTLLKTLNATLPLVQTKQAN